MPIAVGALPKATTFDCGVAVRPGLEKFLAWIKELFRPLKGLKQLLQSHSSALNGQERRREGLIEGRQVRSD